MPLGNLFVPEGVPTNWNSLALSINRNRVGSAGNSRQTTLLCKCCIWSVYVRPTFLVPNQKLVIRYARQIDNLTMSVYADINHTQAIAVNRSHFAPPSGPPTGGGKTGEKGSNPFKALSAILQALGRGGSLPISTRGYGRTGALREGRLRCSTQCKTSSRVVAVNTRSDQRSKVSTSADSILRRVSSDNSPKRLLSSRIRILASPCCMPCCMPC